MTIADTWLSRHSLRFALLGSKHNLPAVSLRPLGVSAGYLHAENETEWIAHYGRANARAFPEPLTLPGWVLTDLYLLPGAIGLLLGPEEDLDPAVREAVKPSIKGEAIHAAYYAAPTTLAHEFVGVSLFRLRPHIGAARAVKALTLASLGARTLRGVAQFGSLSMRAHVAMGPTHLVGRVPAAHTLSSRSFVYETVVKAPADLEASMVRDATPLPPREVVGRTDLAAIARVLERAERGETLNIIAPGTDDEGRLTLG